MAFADFMAKVQRVDNRVIRILVLISIVVPLVNPVAVPMRVTPGPQKLYDFIEQMQPGQVVLMDLYMSASYRANLYPMIEAGFTHLVSKGCKVIFTATAVEGPMFAEEVIQKVAEPAGLVYGIDYVHLGYRAGGEASVAEFLRNFHETFQTDYRGNPIGELELMQGVHSAVDLSLVLMTSTGGYAGGGWVRQLVQPYGVPLAVNVTGNMAPSHYTYTDSGQIMAMVADTKGGAEYETLLKRPGSGLAIMGAQTYAHILVLLFMVIANVAYFTRKGRGEKK